MKKTHGRRKEHSLGTHNAHFGGCASFPISHARAYACAEWEQRKSSDQTAQFTYPDGKSEEAAAKAGQTIWEKVGAHLPENVGKGPIDLILVELRGKPAEKE